MAIKNVGNQAFKASEGYWHVYFPNVGAMESSDGAAAFLALGETNHLRDLINLPIYSKAFLDFGPEYKFLVKKDIQGKVFVNYFFSTNYGYFPKTVKLNEKTGIVAFSDMGYKTDKRGQENRHSHD